MQSLRFVRAANLLLCRIYIHAFPLQPRWGFIVYNRLVAAVPWNPQAKCVSVFFCHHVGKKGRKTNVGKKHFYDSRYILHLWFWTPCLSLSKFKNSKRKRIQKVRSCGYMKIKNRGMWNHRCIELREKCFMIIMINIVV